jgi:hypothetical protein
MGDLSALVLIRAWVHRSIFLDTLAFCTTAKPFLGHTEVDILFFGEDALVRNDNWETNTQHAGGSGAGFSLRDEHLGCLNIPRKLEITPVTAPK